MDLFNTPDKIPDHITAVLNDWDDDADPYKECEHINARLKSLGYTFDWGLSGEPYDLRRIN